MTAQQAIARSQAQTEIVTLDYDRESRLALASECEDSVEGNDVTEYWGASDGVEWRVHMRRPRFAADGTLDWNATYGR